MWVAGVKAWLNEGSVFCRSRTPSRRVRLKKAGPSLGWPGPRELLGKKDLHCLYTNLRSSTEHEDTLISQRLTWLLTIQAFMFAAYGFIVQGLVEEAHDPLPAVKADIALFADSAALSLGLIVILTNMVFCRKVGISIDAAKMALTGLRAIWARQHKAAFQNSSAKYLPRGFIDTKDRFFAPIYGIYPYLHGGGHRIPTG